MAGVCNLEITETSTELREILSKQKNAVNYKKVQALYLMKTGKVETVKELASLLGVHRVTIQKWFKKYKDQGMKTLLVCKKSTGRPSVVSQATLLELREKLNRSENTFKSYEDIHEWLQNNHGIDANYKTIYGLVRYKLKMNLSMQETDLRKQA